jgi:hypothetical protein
MHLQHFFVKLDSWLRKLKYGVNIHLNRVWKVHGGLALATLTPAHYFHSLNYVQRLINGKIPADTLISTSSILFGEKYFAAID